MSKNLPSSKTTLVIMLGASKFPNAKEFTSSEAFRNSASRFRDYFISSEKFGLDEKNLLDLFDSELSADDIDREIHRFFDERFESFKDGKEKIRDVLVYFTGHGGLDKYHDFFLAIQRTRSENIKISSIDIKALAQTLKEKARQLRRYVILDCCFSASAANAVVFQNGVTSPTTKQALDAFAEKGNKKVVDFPNKGVSLFCSSHQSKPSLLTPDQNHTMFSEALIFALEEGSKLQPKVLNLNTIKVLVDEFLITNYENTAPKPEIHSPNQIEGNIANIPFFPNLAFQKLDLSKTFSSEINELILEDRNDDAVELVLKKLEKEPKNPFYYSVLGQAYAHCDKFDEAEIAFRKAVEIRPNSAELHYKLGLVLSPQLKWQEALVSFEQAHKLNPTSLTYEFYVDKTKRKIPPPPPPLHISILRFLETCGFILVAIPALLFFLVKDNPLPSLLIFAITIGLANLIYFLFFH